MNAIKAEYGARFGNLDIQLLSENYGRIMFSGVHKGMAAKIRKQLVDAGFGDYLIDEAISQIDADVVRAAEDILRVYGLRSETRDAAKEVLESSTGYNY